MLSLSPLPSCLPAWIGFVFSSLHSVLGGAYHVSPGPVHQPSPSCSHLQPYLSPLHVPTTIHPPWDNHGDCSNANLALFLAWFTSFPCPPTALRVSSVPSLPFKALHELSQPSLSCPVLSRLLFILRHCGQEISRLLKCLKTGKAIYLLKNVEENCIEANQHLILYL